VLELCRPIPWKGAWRRRPRHARAQLQMFDATCTSALSDVDASMRHCPEPHQGEFEEVLGPLSDSVKRYLEEALRYASFLQVVPERVSMAEQIVHTTRRWAVFALVLPMVTAFLVAIAVSFDVLVAQMRARRRAQRCLCCGISFAPLCVAGVALCAAGELSLGILGSSMCADADAIVLRGASAAFGNKSAMLNFTTFYTAGLGKNPATAQLESIEAGILTVIVVMRKIKQKALKSCPG